MKLTPEQWHLIYQVTLGIVSTNASVIFVCVWRFFVAISSLPRIQKGVRLLFEKQETINSLVEGLEQRVKALEEKKNAG